MALLGGLISLAVFPKALAVVTPLAAPIPGFDVIVPDWQVTIFPNQPQAILNGTVQEVRDEAARLNPNWVDTYIKPDTLEAEETRTVRNSSHFEKRRLQFNVMCDEVMRSQPWKHATQRRIKEGI